MKIKKFTKKWRIWIIVTVIIFLFPFVPYIGSSIIKCQLPSCSQIPIKIFEVMKLNLDYYGSAFGILIAVITFQKQLEIEDLKRAEERSAQLEERRIVEEKYQKEQKELKEKEIEIYSDKYRPSFLQKNNNRVIVLLKHKDLYIKDVEIFEDNDKKGKFLGSLKSNFCIYINAGKNFFITGTTIIGERFLFGSILQGTQIYKVLKHKDKPIIPSMFNSEYNREKVNEVWKSYNESFSSDEEDKFFFYLTYEIREKIGLSININLKEIIKSSSIKDLLNNTLSILSTYYDSFKYNAVNETLDSILLLIEGNILNINLKQIPTDQWNYINKNTNRKKCKNGTAYEVLKYYYDKKNIRGTISCWIMLLNHLDFSDFNENNLELYKNNIIESIIKH